MDQKTYKQLLANMEKGETDVTVTDMMNEPTEAQKELRREARKAANEALSKPFERLWVMLDGPPLKKEFQFFREKGRKWKTDYTHIGTMTMIELEGAIFSEKSGHKGAGQIDDMRKYNTARIEGYQVFTLGTGMITVDDVQPIIDHIRRKEDDASKP